MKLRGKKFKPHREALYAIRSIQRAIDLSQHGCDAYAECEFGSYSSAYYWLEQTVGDQSTRLLVWAASQVAPHASYPQRG